MIDSLNFTDYGTFLTSFLLICLVVFLRYLILSGAYHWLFLVIFKKKFEERILTKQIPKGQQIKRELRLSACSAIIFSVIGMIVCILWQKGYTQIYSDLQSFPLWYIPLSILIYLLLHDTYYYWLHRWMHASKFIRRVHMEHHKSLNTNVLTSFSFHPIESLLQALIFPIILLIVPMSLLAILITLSIMTFSAIVNHAGVEIYPTNNNQIFRQSVIGATHHDLHHRNSKKNFGLYFTFWDKVMKTEL